MVDVWEVQIPTLTGEKKRKAYVYLPEDYEYDEEKRYPVMYMFDGHNLFSDSEATYGKSWGLSDYLDRTGTPLIIAAVECNHEGNERLSEYSPVDFTFRNGEVIKGKGKKYMDWLVNTFKPYIDENLRTLPDREHTAIAGSSMGGLMTLYAITKYNRYFSKGAALSPSLWAYDKKLGEFLEKGTYKKDTVLYMDYGEKEISANYRGIFNSTFTTAVSTLISKKVLLTARMVPGGTHCEASWERQIPIFMRTLGFNPQKN